MQISDDLFKLGLGAALAQALGRDAVRASDEASSTVRGLFELILELEELGL